MTLDIEAMKSNAVNATYLGGEAQEQADNVLALIAEVERLQAQIEALEQIARLDEQIELKDKATIANLHKQVNAVKALHKPIESPDERLEGQICEECSIDDWLAFYPCETLEALGVEE